MRTKMTDRETLARHIAESHAAMVAKLSPLLDRAFIAGMSSEAGRARDDARHAAFMRGAGL